MTSSLSSIAEKVRSSYRLTAEDGLAILRADDVLAVCALAHEAQRRESGDVVYFSVNRHLNYSNICMLRCSFCSYARSPGEEGAYEMSIDEVLDGIPGDVGEAHIVGGLHPDLQFSWYVEMIRAVRRKLPAAGIKAFTAVEIAHLAKGAGLTYEDVLRSLKEAGLTSLPGGGAEVFSHRVRSFLCPRKPSGEVWLEVHETAHRLGIPTNATILYGHIETHEEAVAHLLALRDLQDRTGGFLCFVPLPFQPPRNTTYRGSTPCEDLKMIALSRLVMDNIPHIKAYWVMLGIETATLALSSGADDLDGTVGGERIAHAAGASTPLFLSRDGIIKMCREAGKIAVERDSLYNPVETGRGSAKRPAAGGRQYSTKQEARR
jgi:aminodeoxyfutalosine synthase